MTSLVDRNNFPGTEDILKALGQNRLAACSLRADLLTFHDVANLVRDGGERRNKAAEKITNRVE